MSEIKGPRISWDPPWRAGDSMNVWASHRTRTWWC